MNEVNMKGNNTLIFSQVTMVEAMQQYLNHLFKAGLAPLVNSVNIHGTAFEVEVTEQPELEKVQDCDNTREIIVHSCDEFDKFVRAAAFEHLMHNTSMGITINLHSGVNI